LLVSNKTTKTSPQKKKKPPVEFEKVENLAVLASQLAPLSQNYLYSERPPLLPYLLLRSPSSLQ